MIDLCIAGGMYSKFSQFSSIPLAFISIGPSHVSSTCIDILMVIQECMNSLSLLSVPYICVQPSSNLRSVESLVRFSMSIIFRISLSNFWLVCWSLAFSSQDCNPRVAESLAFPTCSLLILLLFLTTLLGIGFFVLCSK